MARSLSLVRRRTHLVDLTLPVRADVASYQFQAATNFDGAYTTFDTVPAGGKASKSVQDLGIDGSSRFRGQTRFLFDPADYSLDDSKPLWIRIKQVSTAGVVGSAEAGQLVLPYSSAPDRPVVLKGTAPQAADSSGSLEIQLPMQCRNLQFQVDPTVTANLVVSFEPGGPEWTVPALQTYFTNFDMVHPMATQIFVRGDTGAALFNAIMSVRNNPLG